MSTYQIVSTKHSTTYTGSLINAIARAIAIDREYQPAYGVTLATDGGSTLLETDSILSDISLLAEEAADAGDVAQAALCTDALAGDDNARMRCLVIIALSAMEGVR